ncbi:uncharacterized protein PV09_03454 [Verruconis gallopava]|uniref:Uncharacterized protein n=1 Tax=Verruconis gallopava TaxID=253628 RepID=A0A0D2B2S2_9PEZI|nr:uncharacterized protein PV09_03454 [Verruconis gallopava]KIW05579.1 hypothetical protein PV09_03454 [Verruconis gallopava]
MSDQNDPASGSELGEHLHTFVIGDLQEAGCVISTTVQILYVAQAPAIQLAHTFSTLQECFSTRDRARLQTSHHSQSSSKNTPGDIMCKSATCSECHGKTWWGCGNHVPMVMDKVEESDRCKCEPKVEKDGKKYPPMGKTAD